MPINAPADPTPGSMRADASATPTQRRDDHVRRGRRPERRRRHGDLEPGIRHAPSTSGIVDYPSDDPRHADRERPDARHRRQPAAAVRGQARRAVRSIWARRASSIRATCCATRSPCSTPARVPATGVVLSDSVPGEHDLRRRFDAAERTARRAARRRRLAARRGHRHQLLRPDAAAAGRGRRHALAGRAPRSSSSSCA